MSYAYIVTGSRLKHRTLICCDKVNNKSNHVLNIQYNKKLSWGSLILLLRATVLNLSQWRNLYFHLVKIMNSLTKKKKKNEHLHKNQYLNVISGVHLLNSLLQKKLILLSCESVSITELVYSEKEVENICISQSDLVKKESVHMSLCPHGLIFPYCFQ